jgi:hypothetical protein
LHWNEAFFVAQCEFLIGRSLSSPQNIYNALYVCHYQCMYEYVYVIIERNDFAAFKFSLVALKRAHCKL